MKKTKEKPKYPDINVQLTGTEGNVFSVLGKVRAALKRGGAPDEDIKAFISEATKGDYDDALAACMKWVEVN